MFGPMKAIEYSLSVLSVFIGISILITFPLMLPLTLSENFIFLTLTYIKNSPTNLMLLIRKKKRNVSEELKAL